MDLLDRVTSNSISRRKILRRGLVASGIVAAGSGLLHGAVKDAFAASAQRVSNIPKFSAALVEVAVENDPDTRMMVPPGFAVRMVARTGQQVLTGSPYVWHSRPDGGAVFAMNDGGWIYTSNSEVPTRGMGGVGALRFNAAGQIVGAYPICTGTTNNCAGGPTPWGTWLTCEEIDEGVVYECDPTGQKAAVRVPMLGVFKHEAAAVDPVRGHIYLTEDTPDGNFYRFTPQRRLAGGRFDLSSGVLEVLVAESKDLRTPRAIRWTVVPNPVPRLGILGTGETPTRKQVADAESFNGGEGCWYHDAVVYFTTKGDNRVWALDTRTNQLDTIYDKQRDQGFEPGIRDVDNVTVSTGGDIVVAEDGAEMRLIVVGRNMKPFELVNVIGHDESEICGPAFSPDGSRLYFSSQRGVAGNSADGRTYEIRGPFFAAA